MSRYTLKIRFLALFVAVFVCLNGAAAACVAYCQTIEEPVPLSDHCQKMAEQAHGSAGSNAFLPVFEGSEVDCCPMTLSFLAAPLEKHSFPLKHTATVRSVSLRPDLTAKDSSPIPLSAPYRGPPLIDRRPDRIKQRLLRI